MQTNERINVMGKYTTEFMKLVIQNTPDLIYLINREGKILISNIDTQSHNGISLYNYILKPYHKRIKTFLHEVVSSKKPLNCQVKAKFMFGKSGWYSLRISPVIKSGKVNSVIIFAADISERKIAPLSSGKKVYKPKS